MKEKQKGGQRKGAGRKPSTNPKLPITIFVETSTINAYGSKDGFKAFLYEAIARHKSAYPEAFKKDDDMPGFTVAAKKEVRNIKIKDLTASTVDLKPQEQPKANYSMNTTKPKNLEELKALCPSELTGFDRSIWISNERVKYGI